MVMAGSATRSAWARSLKIQSQICPRARDTFDQIRIDSTNWK